MSQVQVEGFPASLSALIEKRPRPMWTIDASSFLMKGFEYPAGGGKIRMRIAYAVEQEDALEAAKQYMLKKSKDATSVDADSLHNARVGYLMHRVCFQGERDVPCFPSGKWMLDNFTIDELAVLKSHYDDCQRLAGPIEFDLSKERLDGLSVLCAAHAASDVPNIYMSGFTREQIAEIAIRWAVEKRDLEKQIAALTALPAPSATDDDDDAHDQSQPVGS